jgi:uncharacterized membrane protein YheB (UPF0754 family)
MNYWLLLLPVISAIIGWLGTWVAGKILVLQIIPARQDDLAEEMGRKAGTEFSLVTITKKIGDPENVKKVMPVVEAHIDDFLRHKLKAKMPVVGMLIGDKTINSLKEVFLKEIEEMFPEVINKFTGNLESELNIKALVTAKIKTIQPAKMQEALSPVLRYFRFAGAVTGFITGLVNTGLFLLLYL